MPELPEVQTVVSELNRKLRNRTIKSVEVLRPKMVSVGPAVLPPKRKASAVLVSRFIRLLQRQKILSVTRRAKLLIFDFKGPYTMLVHLKMTGQFIYLKNSELDKKIKIVNSADSPGYAMPCPYTHVIFNFTDGSWLFYNDLRQFGFLKLVSDEDLPKVADLREFGPEPLSPAFTCQVFTNILDRRPTARIKQLLTEQKLIAGIGNIYSDEILFRAHVRPDRTVQSLLEKDKRAIFAAIPFILRKGIAAHGSSVGDFVRTDGSWGSMGKHHFVYGRTGEKCKVCGTIIKSMKFDGRTGSFCPKCQK